MLEGLPALQPAGPCRYTLWRMTACGQTMMHLPHWMHRSDSQTGMSSARLRFSHCVVPVREGAVHRERRYRDVIAVEGDDRPKHIRGRIPVLRPGPAAGGSSVEVIFAGTLTSYRLSMVLSTASKFFCTTASPRLP